MAYHHPKTSCPAQDKNCSVLSRMQQTCSAITLIEEIFYMEKILGIFQGTYDQNQKGFPSEFLDVE